MTDQIIEKYALKGRAPSAFILYNNEVIAKLKDAGTIITNQTKRDIADQWKSPSNVEGQKHKDLSEAAKEELAKHKDLFPAESKEVKVLYLERVSPIVKPSIREFLSLVLWGDAEMKTMLHQFDKIGGYDSERMVVHFTEVVEGSGNEGGVSHISTADVHTMTSTFVTVAGLLMRQNMLMAKLIGFEIQCNPQVEMAQGMDVNNVQLMGQAATLLKG